MCDVALERLMRLNAHVSSDEEDSASLRLLTANVRLVFDGSSSEEDLVL